MSDRESFPHLCRKSEIEANAFAFTHPWNPNSRIEGTHLSTLGGLERSGVSIVRVPPGRDSLVYHLHHREEEWMYILSGRAVARIDGADFPDHDRRMVRLGDDMQVYRLSDGRPLLTKG